MEIFVGKKVYAGVALGPVRLYRKGGAKVQRFKVSDTERELQRFRDTVVKSLEQMDGLAKKTKSEIGESEAEIFLAQRMIAEDEYLKSRIEDKIRTEGVNAEYAVSVTGKELYEHYESMEDAYIRERASDIKDVTEKWVDLLIGKHQETLTHEKEILLADEISPAEMMGIDRKKILAIVTTGGAIYSHMAILAASMEIPTIVGAAIDIRDDMEGKMALVDAKEGKIYLSPDAGLIRQKETEAEEEKQKRIALEMMKGVPAVTKYGRRIALYANISGEGDLSSVERNDAEGIGLFRTEFLYMGRKDLPSEEEQVEVYRRVALTMKDKKVIIRTMDIGSDKEALSLTLPKEDNPAMGMRAIRICLTNTELFKIQLRAVLRAGVYGNLSVMFPMITSTEEVRQSKEILMQAKEELRRENLPFAEEMETGIMVETPAAMMIADELAKEVNFFSVGTNDLTQYMLAVDRQNPALDRFYDAHHPAVLKALERIAECGTQAGIPVGICGELAADHSMTKSLIEMGYTEFSVSSEHILELRALIRELDI